jgi:hypothetical protein
MTFRGRNTTTLANELKQKTITTKTTDNANDRTNFRTQDRIEVQG